MMDKYKEEMSDVHASLDLIMKTKAAIKDEEIKYQKELESNKISDIDNDAIDEVSNVVDDNNVVEFKARGGKLKIAMGIFVAAAAVAIVIIVGGLNRRDKEEQIGKLVSGKDDIQGTEISGSNNNFEVVELDISDSIPAEFENIEELSEGDLLYRYISLDEGGTKVFVKQSDKAYIFTFKASNISLILPMITDYLGK